tara:strand:+ start:858 stop:1427 length:570 start_codon:yes stop_codon:yes gene_type:complete
MDAGYLAEKHAAGVGYDEYLKTGNPGQVEGWTSVYKQSHLTDPQQHLIQGFSRKMNVLVVSGIWCGDCAQQGPLIARIAQANPKVINLRWVDRDEHADLQDRVRINAGNRVPVVIFCAEDFQLIYWFGDRTLWRYRAIAKTQLGASCPLPGASLDQEELEGTLQDWIDQFERAHLLVRLSTRLRQIHGD